MVVKVIIEEATQISASFFFVEIAMYIKLPKEIYYRRNTL